MYTNKYKNVHTRKRDRNYELSSNVSCTVQRDHGRAAASLLKRSVCGGLGADLRAAANGGNVYFRARRCALTALLSGEPRGRGETQNPLSQRCALPALPEGEPRAQSAGFCNTCSALFSEEASGCGKRRVLQQSAWLSRRGIQGGEGDAFSPSVKNSVFATSLVRGRRAGYHTKCNTPKRGSRGRKNRDNMTQLV